MGTEFIQDREIYQRVLRDELPKARDFLWIGTSDLKDLYMDKDGKRKMVPLLEILSDLVKQQVSIRLIHAKEPGKAFREDFDRYPNLIEGLERLLCPRVHFKCVVVDGRFAYTGSANLTGAGMGAKSENRRNFESGIISTEPEIIEPVMEQFDQVWMGKHCRPCQRKEFCAEYKDILAD
ncbi:MAG: phospholipase D-like domain-containing protein [Planctomycetota bacterium]|jgi:phosphatidylserine/phosphatidylglycerophosphate/cardiolipin synthase-like enzyme